MLNCWLQRDLSIYGRALLSKAEGLSRFVYPALSLHVKDSNCKDINNLFFSFIWKNKSQRLKKRVLTNMKAEGGLDMLYFEDVNKTFKINWLKRCLITPNSLWNHIPHSLFNQIGGLKFLLTCDYNISKIPLKLSKFHQQALLAWKICYCHNFSPHTSFIWNNGNITVSNKSLFLTNWFNRDIHHLIKMFDNSGNLLTYEQFLSTYSFPVQFREFNSVIKAIPVTLRQLVKSHICYNSLSVTNPNLILEGVELTKKKCNNKHICNIFQKQNKISPRGKNFWNSKIENIVWRRAWLIPFKYCINNKIKETHFKILHTIYPSKSLISRFSDIDDICCFCNNEKETLTHLFFDCNVVNKFWSDLADFIFNLMNVNYGFTLKDVILYYENKSNKDLECIVNLFILLAKFHIHKQKFLNSSPMLNLFCSDFDFYISSLRLLKNKRSVKCLEYYDALFNPPGIL